ncbi:hypothetical protein LXL04_017835 [Taraxacum kok-saghyz]
MIRLPLSSLLPPTPPPPSSPRDQQELLTLLSNFLALGSMVAFLERLEQSKLMTMVLERHKTTISILRMEMLCKVNTCLSVVVKWWRRMNISSLASSLPGHEWEPFPNGIYMLVQVRTIIKFENGGTNLDRYKSHGKQYGPLWKENKKLSNLLSGKNYRLPCGRYGVRTSLAAM